MKKEQLKWILMCILCLGLGASITSCADDDDEKSEEATEAEQEKQAQKLTSERDAFWSIVGQLTAATTLPEDWKSATFEPTYGEADPDNARQRIVVVNNAEEAAQLFANLVGDNTITGDTPHYNYQTDNVSLHYVRSNDGRSVATVDVAIRQMPRLQKIAYKTPEQLGTNTLFNGSFDGSAYYRFGDVVRKHNADGNPEYWICVRPAFSYERKGDSHWITLSGLPEDNLWHNKASNGIDYYLPTKLGNNSTQEENFAEMLYAVLNPEKWEQNVSQNAKLDMFNGFSRDYIDYHNKEFWRRVASGWQAANIMERCFAGMSLDQLRQSIDQNGLEVLYDGFSWLTSISWSPTLYARNYSGMNLKTVAKKKYSKSVKDNLQLDFTGSYYRVFERHSAFFGDSKPRWVIRHATGKELGGHDDPKRQLDGVEEIYVYNRFFYENKNYAQDDEILSDIPQADVNERGYFVPGDIMRDIMGNRWLCVQSSNSQVRYSYFISFGANALLGAKGTMTNLPSEMLALQMLNQIISCVPNYFISKDAAGANSTIIRRLKEYGDYDVESAMAVYMYYSEVHRNIIKNYVGNALYRTQDDKIGIVRLMHDGSVQEHGRGRSIEIRCYDSYMQNLNSAPRKMLLDDLFDANIVSQYNTDPVWGNRPVLVPPYLGDLESQTMQPRKRTSVITETNLEQWLYTPALKFPIDADYKARQNMYNEPVLAFAVKRILDEGKENLFTEDGTVLLPVNKHPYASPFNDDFTDFAQRTYRTMIQDVDGLGIAVFLNDNEYDFGDSNEP